MQLSKTPLLIKIQTVKEWSEFWYLVICNWESGR